MKLALKEKIWIGTFIGLWLIVSSVSTLHSVEFFKLSNSVSVSWFLALAFEFGAIASLGGLVISRGSKWLIWTMFSILTAFQIHCNMYWCWVNAEDLTQWINLLDLVDEESNLQLRIFSGISGGILPVLALGFTKSLMDYLNPSKLEPVDNSTSSEIPTEDLERNEEFNNKQMAKDGFKTDSLNAKDVIDSKLIYKEGDDKIRVEYDPNIIKDAFENLSSESEQNAKQLTDYVESLNKHQDYMEDMSDEETMEHIDKEIKDHKNKEWSDVISNNKSKPFWAHLNPKQTVKLLDANNDYMKNELPKGNKNKS